MTTPSRFCQLLSKQEIEFFCGVPDSLLKNLCAYIDDHYQSAAHVITANEGNAVAMASGYHLTTGKAAMVYMQNSGLGNTVNPLTSLADPQVYSIPMLLVIGWRGEPSVKDEPQHIKQGAVSEQMLDVLGIPYVILSQQTQDSQLDTQLNELMLQMHQQKRPVALLVRKGAFEKEAASTKTVSLTKALSQQGKSQTYEQLLYREQALKLLIDEIPDDALIVSTTGKTSRELFELRKAQGRTCADFLTVGAMGHASSIAMGAAIGNPQRLVVVIDGDGALLMHMGALPVIGQYPLSNLLHIVLNNGCHESVGGQATVANEIDIPNIADACGYQHCWQASSAQQIKDSITEALVLSTSANITTANNSDENRRANMIEVKIQAGSRDDLGRPTSTTIENKQAFMSKANAG